MNTNQLHDDAEWVYVQTLLPPDLEKTAFEAKALTRRRNIPNAATLIRIILAYAVSDLSLKDVAAWAKSINIATVTGPGLFYRLRESEEWLKTILAQILCDEVAQGHGKGYKLRVVDATVINGPGSRSTDWRVHLLSDPMTGKFISAEITDRFGGEGLARHPIRAGEVVLGDRMYATARGVYATRKVDAHVLVRLNPHTLRVCDQAKRVMNLLSEESRVPRIGVFEWKILIPVPPEKITKSHKTWDIDKAIDWIPARVVAARTKEGRTIWLLTTLPEKDLSGSKALKLYRLRWQIELTFKRLKSLLNFDMLPSRQGPTANAWILGRLVAAALAQKLLNPSGALSPWGYEFRDVSVQA